MKRGSNTVIPYEDIDYELVELIKCINDVEGIETVECCCGHGVEPCQIWFVADSLKDVTHFIRDYLYRSSLWRIIIDITDVDIDENKWDSPTYLLETTCNDYYYTGVCIDNLTYKMKMKQLTQKKKTGWSIIHGVVSNKFYCTCGYIEIMDNSMNDWNYCPICGGMKMEESE